MFECGFVDVDNVGWYNDLKKTYHKVLKAIADEQSANNASIADKTTNKKQRYAIGKIEHDIEPFIKKILKKYDFSDDIEKMCKIATIKLRKVLIAYFGDADYKKYVATAKVYANDDGDVSVELGYSKDIWKSDNVEKWSLSDAKTEFSSK
jgi:hypothetical protein